MKEFAILKLMGLGKFLKISLVGLIVLAVVAAVYLTVAGKTEIRTKAGRIEEALVFLMPAEMEIEPGERIDFSLKIDTGKRVAGGVDIYLNFDPLSLRLVNPVEPGPAFPELTSEENSGRIILRGQGSLIGQGTVATLSFKGVSSGETTIEISDDSIVWDEEKNNNILRNAAGTKVTVE